MSRKDQKQPEVVVRSLRPHPKMFWVLLITFVIWVAALLGLYFKTVYPRHHPSTGATTPMLPAIGSTITAAMRSGWAFSADSTDFRSL